MPLYRAELQRRRGLLPPVLIHDLSQVLYLPFDKDDGSYARDRSGYVNHGTIIGATRVAGKIGGALSFDGVNDYVKVLDSSSLRNPVLSVAFWVSVADITKTWLRIADKGTFITQWRGFNVIYRSSTVGFACDFGTGDTEGRVSWLPPDLANNVFYHLVFTYDGSTGRLYGNGVLRSSRVQAYTDDPSNLFIGSRDGIADWFLGIIDEVRIYNRALSAAEIARLMNMRGI